MDPVIGDPGASFPADGLPGLLAVVNRLIMHAGHRLGWIDALHRRGLLSAPGLFLALLGLLLLLVLPPLIGLLLRRAGRLEANFRGERIPQSYGLVTLLWACAMLIATAFLFPALRAHYEIWLAACAGFGLLGFVDDTWGTKRIKGLRGHFRALAREHIVTTGLIKAVGGALLALWLGHRIQPENPLLALLTAALIALGANAVNLLDLRPGRAGGVFLIIAVPLIVAALRGGSVGAPPLLLVAIPALLVWQRDARAQVMMGDTGSNLLGAALGLALVQDCSLPVQLTALALLVALHIVAERVSLTSVIERNRLLNALDRLTGVR